MAFIFRLAIYFIMPKDLSSSLRGGENFFSMYFTILMDYRGKERLNFFFN